MPTYFHRTAGMSISEAGMKTSGIMILALIGLPLGGWLADMWFKKRARARLLFPAITTALAAIVLFIAISLFTGTAQYITLLGMGVLASAFAPAAITATQETIHAGLRAISYSLCVVFQNLLGASMAPIVIGKLSDLYGIQFAMSTLPIFLVISALVFFTGSFFYEKDLSKVEKVTLECED